MALVPKPIPLILLFLTSKFPTTNQIKIVQSSYVEMGIRILEIQRSNVKKNECEITVKRNRNRIRMMQDRGAKTNGYTVIISVPVYPSFP